MKKLSLIQIMMIGEKKHQYSMRELMRINEIFNEIFNKIFNERIHKNIQFKTNNNKRIIPNVNGEGIKLSK